MSHIKIGFLHFCLSVAWFIYYNGYSEHVAYVYMKIGSENKKNQISYCSRSKQMCETDQNNPEHSAHLYINYHLLEVPWPVGTRGVG